MYVNINKLKKTIIIDTSLNVGLLVFVEGRIKIIRNIYEILICATNCGRVLIWVKRNNFD